MSRKKKKKASRTLRLDYNDNLQKAGLPPGTVLYTGEKTDQPSRLTLMDYDVSVFKEQTLSAIEQAFDYKTTLTTTWLNIDGLSDVSVVEKVGSQFDLHPLVIEDIVVPNQRPKLEDYDDYLFIVARMLRYDRATNDVINEQVTMILRKNFLITFQETIGDVFDQIRDRLRANKGRIRKMSADHLVYSLIDAIVDHYFAILDNYGEKIETLEEELLYDPEKHTLAKIHEFKRELTILRKCVWPMRELANAMIRSESELITESTKVYLRDVYDHTIQIIDTIESLRDIVASLMEIYLSNINTHLNAVMKVLTIIATIFMPLGFFASVYGMNFKHMPELQSYWMYPVGFWTLIVVVGVGMVIVFKRQKWF